MTKKPVIHLNGKFYHSYESDELEAAKKRARILKNNGKDVTLRWMETSELEAIENQIKAQLEKITELETELEDAKKRMNNDSWTWGRANPGTIKRVNKLEAELKVLREEVYSYN